MVVSIRPHASLAAGVCVFGRVPYGQDTLRTRLVRFDVDATILSQAEPAVQAGDTHEFGYIQQLVHRSEETFVVAVAVDLLARREHSAAELHRKLAARGFTEKARDYALKRVTSSGYQSDNRFASEWIRATMRRKHIGRAALLAGLQRAGVGRREAEAAVAEYELEHPGCFDAALIAAIATMEDASYEQKHRRLFQRGFDYSHIRRYLS